MRQKQSQEERTEHRHASKERCCTGRQCSIRYQANYVRMCVWGGVPSSFVIRGEVARRMCQRGCAPTALLPASKS